MRNRLGLFAVLLLIALPTFAADRVIQSGIDPWRTLGNGSTFIDFSKAPIPAGFFCFKSAPFAQRIVFQGVPVATAEPGALGRTDTIIQRLDDAVFDATGVARTRIQVRALHFVSVEPIQTACGAYSVEVHLNGEQPVTNMRIVRDDDHSGHFFAPISVNGKLVFKPVNGSSSEILEMVRNVRFPANQGGVWADRFPPNRGVRWTGFVQVDTDNDRIPDTFLPGTTTGFAAGAPSRGLDKGVKTQLLAYCGDETIPSNCHCVSQEAVLEGHCPVY
jgi:hypothetical protein